MQINVKKSYQNVYQCSREMIWREMHIEYLSLSQIPLVIGAVAGFTVLSVLIMGFVCFLRSDRCCVARNTVPALQQVHW